MKQLVIAKILLDYPFGQLLEHLKPKLTSSTFGQEEIRIIAIFSLILHYSTRQILVEASKAILLDKSLASALEKIVQASCGKGPTLVCCDEDTPAGETLIFVLLLYFFSLRRLVVLTVVVYTNHLVCN